MSRLNYKVGDKVTLTYGGVEPMPHIITRVEPALNEPYFLDDNEWHEEADLSTYVEPDPTWEQVEAHVRHIVEELRAKFADNDESDMRFMITATGRPDGDIKIKYTIDGDYNTQEVNGYSLRPTLDEFFRRKVWKSRNEPLSLTHAESES